MFEQLTTKTEVSIKKELVVRRRGRVSTPDGNKLTEISSSV